MYTIKTLTFNTLLIINRFFHMIDALCSITAGILFQLSFFPHNIYLIFTIKVQETQVSLHVPCFLSEEKSWCLTVLVFRYHLPLLLQSFGVKWRHLGSIRKCLFCIALSCPSTISSESVRMYWPYRKNKSNIRRWTLCVCSDPKPMFSAVI